MKLFYSKGACSLAARIAINEMNIPCEYEAVNLADKVTEKGDDFYKINPKGAVPTIITDDKHVLTENAVIHQYLADTHKAVNLLPPVGQIRRYQILEWLNYITTELHKGFGPLFNSEYPEEAKTKFVLPLLKKKFQFVDKQLQSHAYIAGDEYTLPDGYLFVMLLWATFKKIDLSDCPALLKYFEKLKQRPAVQKSLHEEGLHLG